MENRERIAHHEAAHAVIAYVQGVRVGGIDIDSSFSPTGKGGAILLLEDFVEEDSEDDKRGILFRSLMIACAGAACDAKILGRPACAVGGAEFRRRRGAGEDG